MQDPAASTVETVETVLPPANGFRPIAPFLFIDGISEYRLNEFAAAHWDLKPDAFFFAAHFPKRPVVPGSLLIEALAQLLGSTLNAGGEGGVAGFLAGVKKARFYRSVVPGDRLDMTVTITTMTDSAAEALCVGKVGEEVAVKATMTMAIMDPAAAGMA